MSNEVFTQITQSLLDGDPDATVDFTRQAIAAGVEPMTIIEQGLMTGMQQVGDKFAEGEFFLPDLIMAADGMQKAMKILEPELHARQQKIESAGTVVLGTVKGDIHAIGKSLVGTMLAANGFTVWDLGVDVPVARFIEKIKETGAQIVGLSALLTTTMIVQGEVIRALAEAGLRERVKVIVGGSPVSRSWAEEIGADGYAEDAMDAVQLVRQLVGN